MPDSIVFNWLRDERDTSSIRAEIARVGGFELNAFQLPSTIDAPTVYGWEIFTGPQYATRLTGGTGVTFETAKRNSEAAFQNLVTAC